MKGCIFTVVAAALFFFPGHPASQEARFVVNADGTVTDHAAGLVWQREDDGVSMDWEAALAYCQDLELAGFTDWRLPHIKELGRIVDNSRSDPSIDTRVFPGTNSAGYWSSSTSPADAANAYPVYFHYGYVTCCYKGFLNYVRCVR